jgi:RpiB/LacA/LacB family sugar-phosphate isomerase
MSRQIVTGDDVRDVPAGGELRVSPGAVITPWAVEVAATRGVKITSSVEPAVAAVTVALGADHGGLAVKEQVKGVLTRLGHRYDDKGTFGPGAVDYPDFALAVARAVRAGEAQLGIVVDGAGIGSAMAANKVPGVRAAVCVDVKAARNAREHNDANVMTLGAGFLDPAQLKDMVEAFVTVRCTEERHRRRVAKIQAIEETYLK